MKIFGFDPGVGGNLDQYHSSSVFLSKVAHWTEEAVDLDPVKRMPPV